MAFQKGHTLNKGIKTGRIPSSAFKKGDNIGNQNGFIKGQVPRNKGLTNRMSEESKLSMIAKKRGIKPTEDSNRRNSESHMGSKAYQRTGGSYGRKKKQTLLRDNFTCQMCGMIDTDIMQVDHIKPKCLFPELQFEMSNLMTLCPNCHARKTIREKKQKYDIRFYE